MPLFDKIFSDETHEGTALLGLCDVTINGESYKNERIRLDLDNGAIRIEAAKFDRFDVPFGRPKVDEFLVRNVSIHSRGIHLFCKELPYSFVGGISGTSLDIKNTPLSHVTGFFSRPDSVNLICNQAIEFEVDTEGYERRFYSKFDVWNFELTDKIKLVGSKSGFSIIGKDVFEHQNIDKALSLVVGGKSVWASEWENKILRLRLNLYKKTPLRTRPIINTDDRWISVEEISKNSIDLFPIALKWLNGLEKQQLIKASTAIDSLLSAREYQQDYLLGLFGVFRFWEWASKSKTLSEVPLAKCLDISKEEARALIDLRNDLIHNYEFSKTAVEKCHDVLKDNYNSYLSEYDMDNTSATVMNYVHSITADTLLKIIGYKGKTQKYFPVSGHSRIYKDV